ncbi:hypothetical protein [Lentzea terrae]|uniref:hypothetical protein n=1 Tax=Lentzea terrae TaxID=2200761 RepID=UPI001E503A0A|nr:hypothetical protein [Lentzea terrae]
MRDLPRRSVLSLLGAAGLAAGVPGVAAAQPPPDGWRTVAEDVRNETRWAWRS